MTRVVVVDLDGTLVPGNTFHAWIRHLALFMLRRGRLLGLGRLLTACLLRAVGRVDHQELKRAVLPLSQRVPAHERERFARRLAATARPELLDRLAAATQDGVQATVSTAAPDLYVGELCALLGIASYDATPAVLGPTWVENLGERKVTALTGRFGGDVDVETLYTDHADDLPLARRARRTVLVDPRPGTMAMFREQGLEVEELGGPARSVARHGVSTIMVTFNSDQVLGRAVAALEAGTRRPDRLVIVDNGSEDTHYLHEVADGRPWVEVVEAGTNLGFCAGNNLGLEHAHGEHVLLLNPDAFVSPTFLAEAVQRLDDDPSIGALSPKLLGADAGTGAATGRIDSIGIEQDRFGRLHDVGQGEPDHGQHDGRTTPSALCAAAMLIRAEAVSDLTRVGQLFDERFFMYKEDIDLSWRLRRAGWRLTVDTSVTTLHCRGWQRDRRRMPRWARTRSMRNEWRMWARGWAPETPRWQVLPYLVAKSVLVAAGR